VQLFAPSSNDERKKGYDTQVTGFSSFLELCLQSVLSATQQWSCGQIEQAPREVSKSFLLRARPHDRSDFVPEDLAL